MLDSPTSSKDAQTHSSQCREAQHRDVTPKLVRRAIENCHLQRVVAVGQGHKGGDILEPYGLKSKHGYAPGQKEQVQRRERRGDDNRLYTLDQGSKGNSN